MAFVKTVNIDHLAEGAVVVAQQQSGIPLDLTRSTSLIISTIGDSKWIGGTVASANLIFDIRNIFTDLTKKIIIGQRIVTGNVAGVFRVGGFYNGASSFYEAEFTIAFLNAGTGPAPQMAINTEYYVESIVDFVTGKFAVNVNGQERWSKTYPVATLAQIASTYSYYFVGTNAGATTWNAKDFTFQQAVGSEVISPTGPVFVRQPVFSNIVAPQFFPSIGYNILQSLTTKQTDAFTYLFPNGVSDKGALAGDILGTITGIDYVPANGQILNMEVWASAGDTSPVPRSMTGKATSGGVTKTGTPAPMTGVVQYNKFNLQMPLALDGAPWTLAKVLGTNFGAAVS